MKRINCTCCWLFLGRWKRNCFCLWIVLFHRKRVEKRRHGLVVWIESSFRFLSAWSKGRQVFGFWMKCGNKVKATKLMNGHTQRRTCTSTSVHFFSRCICFHSWRHSLFSKQEDTCTFRCACHIYLFCPWKSLSLVSQSCNRSAQRLNKLMQNVYESEVDSSHRTLQGWQPKYYGWRWRLLITDTSRTACGGRPVESCLFLVSLLKLFSRDSL